MFVSSLDLIGWSETVRPMSAGAGYNLMTQKCIKSRTAMTAVAAVIALSSTPLLAQDASVPDPVADTATETPVTVTPDPLAPDPAATTTAAPDTADTSEAAPAARRSASATCSSRSRTAAPARAAPAAPAAAPASEAPAEPVVPMAAEMAPPIAEPIAPLAAELAPVEQTDMIEDAAPIAGAAGLGLLALVGAGLVMRRRRRRREDEEFEATQWALAHPEAEAQPEPAMAAPEPVFARAPAPMHDPAPAHAAAAALPAGFDLSRFGRHVQAAYRGPTPDNPSLSLKNRLRRASFFDQQERRVAEEGGAMAKPAAPAWTSRKPNEAEFMFRPAAKKTALRPAFQK